MVNYFDYKFHHTLLFFSHNFLEGEHTPQELLSSNARWDSREWINTIYLLWILNKEVSILYKTCFNLTYWCLSTSYWKKMNKNFSCIVYMFINDKDIRGYIKFMNNHFSLIWPHCWWFMGLWAEFYSKTLPCNFSDNRR